MSRQTNFSSMDPGTPPLWRLALIVALAAFLVDLASKSWAVATIGSDIVPMGVFALTVVHNDAFAFSSGAGALSPVIVLGIRMSVILLVGMLAMRAGALSSRNATGFALLIAGGLGNAADVLLRGGAVVDFISTTPLTFTVGGEPLDVTFVFNIADVWVLAGICLLSPLFRQLGQRVQERVASFEQRVLVRGTG